ncbi:MAG: hypothetical protein WBQ54_12085 [Pseudolabrys sp.]
MLSQRALTEPADDYQAGGYANADRERFLCRRLQSCNSGSDIERCTHGSLGIVLVRTGIAEIGQNPVTSKIRNEAVIGQRDAGASGLKGVDHGAHVLWIQSRRQGCRAHHVADHHGQVAALARSYRLRPPDIATAGVIGKSPRHCLDSPDEALPVAQRHPELFKIVFGQLGQHIKVDRVLGERRLVLSES